MLQLNHVPNGRIMVAHKILQWLLDEEDSKTVGEMQQEVQQLPYLGIDPEIFWALGEELGYNVNISWSDSNIEGRYNVIFSTSCVVQETTQLRHPWDSYSNNPLQARVASHLVPRLQTYLAEKLPEYAIPSAFVVLESLPVSPNGKLDRRALSQLEVIKSGNYVEPANALQETLVKIYAEVLGLQRVGIKDNFFSLGGHSLLATQLVSRLRDSLGIELPLRCVFEAPTPCELAKLTETLNPGDNNLKTPPLLPVSRENRRRKLSSLNNDG